jgi:hypothetical protein
LTIPARPVRWLTSSSTINTFNNLSTGSIVSFQANAPLRGLKTGTRTPRRFMGASAVRNVRIFLGVLQH